MPWPPARPGSEPPFAPFAEEIIRGEEKYADIHGPILTIFACPHNPAHMPIATDKKDEFLAWDQARTEAQAKAFEKLSSAKVVLLPNADHYVFLSNEQQVEKAMKDFLTSIDLTAD